MDPAIYARVSAVDGTLPITHTQRGNVTIPSTSSSSDDSDLSLFLERSVQTARWKSTLKHLKKCKCGHVIHVAKNWCEKCGRQKTPNTIDWNTLKSKAPICETLATKRVFNTICELKAAHDHDVIVFIHNKDEKKDKFRVWGTPGDAQQLLEDEEFGDAMRESWKANFEIGGKIKKPAGHAPAKRRRMETMPKVIQELAHENDDKICESSSTSSSSALLPYQHREAPEHDSTSEYEPPSNSEETSQTDPEHDSTSEYEPPSNSEETSQEDSEDDGTTTLSSASPRESPRRQPSKAAEEGPKDDESSTSSSSSLAHSSYQKPRYFISDPDVYEAERIVASKMCKKEHVVKYQIKWKGYPKSMNTWEPEENIIDKSLLKLYRNPRKRSKK